MSNPDRPNQSNQQHADPEPDLDTAMQIPLIPSRVRQLTANLQSIQSRITAATTARTKTSTNQPNSQANTPRLVAVSKLKPASDILSLHTSSSTDPHLHFGENYVQELLEKSRLLPRTVRWHFIGALQSNKAAQLARDVPNLWAVESVDSVKKATLLSKGRGESGQKEGEKLRVFVQVNTSGEESKSGLEPESDELLDLCRTIKEDTEKCGNLTLQGLMTIGAIARSQATGPEQVNEDFEVLRRCRDWVADQLQMDKGELELSMGMSEDFEGAIAQGSDEVRVGSTIFGARPPKSEAKVLEYTEEEKS